MPSGGQVDMHPSSWHRLGGSPVSIQARNANGQVVSRRTVRPRRSRHVSRLRLKVRTRKGDERMATVRVRYRSVPRAANVVVAVHARRGNRLVASKSVHVPARRANGAKAYRIPIGLPKGRYTLRASSGVVVQSPTGISTSHASARQIFRAR